jgi:carboxylate-amine ligase
MRFDPEIMKLLRLDLAGDKRHLVIRSAVGREHACEYSFGIEEVFSC